MGENTPTKPSKHTCTNPSLHLDAKWCSRTDEPNHSREGDDNARAGWTKVGVLGRGIADNIIFDKYVVVTSNTAPSATITLVGKSTDL